jgi:hypothetical protein
MLVPGLAFALIGGASTYFMLTLDVQPQPHRRRRRGKRK